MIFNFSKLSFTSAKPLVTEMVTFYPPGQQLVSHNINWSTFIVQVFSIGLGGKPLQYNQLSEADLDELAKTKPTLTYGSASKPAPVEFVPAHVAFDKKVEHVI